MKITYKYNNKEISTPASEGFLTYFLKTKDWIEWLQKEFELAEEDFKKEQFNIQFKNETTQKEFMKLFYTNEEALKMPWGKDDKEFAGIITRPPIYLHPIIEDTLKSKELNLTWTITPHTLRRSFASILHYDLGLEAASLQQLLGHSQFRTTEKYLKKDTRFLLTNLQRKGFLL